MDRFGLSVDPTLAAGGVGCHGTAGGPAPPILPAGSPAASRLLGPQGATGGTDQQTQIATLQQLTTMLMMLLTMLMMGRLLAGGKKAGGKQGGAAPVGGVPGGGKSGGGKKADGAAAGGGPVGPNPAGAPKGAHKARGTAYFPSNDPIEGGFNDRKGHKLNTLQDYLAGKAPYVSVAMDTSVPYGTHLRIPELEKKYGRKIDFRVVDTGGAFRGKGLNRIDIAVANRSATYDGTINGPLTLNFG